MRSKITEKVLDRIIYKEADKTYKEITKTEYTCDKCGRKTQAVTTCLGCNKDFCYSCVDHYHDSDKMTHKQFVVGSCDIDCETVSDDYRIAKLHLCKYCSESPPEKLMNLYLDQEGLKYHLEKVVKFKGKIIDEIKRLETENEKNNL